MIPNSNNAMSILEFPSGRFILKRILKWSWYLNWKNKLWCLINISVISLIVKPVAAILNSPAFVWFYFVFLYVVITFNMNLRAKESYQRRLHTFQETKYLFYYHPHVLNWNLICLWPYRLQEGYLCKIKPWHSRSTPWTHIWCKFLPSAVTMHKKSYPHSLCYGFIFNLLVALCTIGFMCYFLYRFDSRLVSLERRLWDKQRDESVTVGRKPAFIKHENHKERMHFKETNGKRLEDSYLQRGVSARARKTHRKRVLKTSSWDAG